MSCVALHIDLAPKGWHLSSLTFPRPNVRSAQRADAANFPMHAGFLKWKLLHGAVSPRVPVLHTNVSSILEHGCPPFIEPAFKDSGMRMHMHLPWALCYSSLIAAAQPLITTTFVALRVRDLPRPAPLEDAPNSNIIYWHGCLEQR